MRKAILILFIPLIFTFHSSYAQNDSTYLDLGRIKLRKDFTQTITIKGSDLEKLPFTNLTQVINVWLHGVYTNPQTVIYIIDGLLVSDVNSYSIYDIDEITLVQNAVIQINGIHDQQQLIIINTKKYQEKQGINASVNTFLVNNTHKDQPTGKSIQSASNLYHQYYLSAYHNTPVAHYGASIDYLRDVQPAFPSSYKIDQPLHLDRIHIRTYMDVQLGKKNTLSVNAIFTPQSYGYKQSYQTDSSFANYYQLGNEAMLTASANLKTNLLPYLINELHFGYNFFNGHERFSIDSQWNSNKVYYQSNYDLHTHNFLVQDNITYNNTIGNWNIEPSLNFSWRQMRGDKQGYQGEMSNQQVWNSGYSIRLASKYTFITPSVNIYYKEAFNIQGGWMRDLTNYGFFQHDRWHPFVSLFVAPFNFRNNNPSVNWKLYGSYSEAGNFYDNTFKLYDFTIDPSADPATDPGINRQSFYSTSGTPPIFYLYNISDSSFWMAYAGSSLSFLNNRLQFSYAFENRKYFPQVYIPSPYGSNFSNYVLTYIPSWSVTHHMAITGKILDRPKLTWTTQLNSTIITSKYLTNINFLKALYAIGDIKYLSHSLTGGWTNRLRIDKINAGADILYWFGNLQLPRVALHNVRSIGLQNIFIGYNLHSTLFNDVNVYISARNLLLNNESLIYDQRKYYGIGLKVTL